MRMGGKTLLVFITNQEYIKGQSRTRKSNTLVYAERLLVLVCGVVTVMIYPRLRS